MYIQAYDSICMGNRMISSETTSQAHKLLHHHLRKTLAQEHKSIAVTRPKWFSVQLLGGAAVFGATQGHVKQLLHCSVLHLGVNNKMCPGHEMYTAAVWMQFHFYSLAVSAKREEASRG